MPIFSDLLSQLCTHVLGMTLNSLSEQGLAEADTGCLGLEQGRRRGHDREVEDGQ